MSVLKNLFIAHIRNIITTLGSIYRKPLNNLVIVFLIGAILSLPLLGFIIIKSLEQTSELLSQQLTMHVYLQNNLTPNEITNLEQQIYDLGVIKNINFMSKAQALAQLDKDLVELLTDNPLPDMLVLTLTNPRQLSLELASKMEALPGVDMIASDIAWINNFNNIIQIISIVTLALGAMIVISIGIMITNTIKLLLERQREQIKINRLIGATTGFILREFMYYGFWYGLLGAILAIIITTICIFAAKLAIIQTLGGAINLPWYFLSLEDSAIILAIASMLGLLSAAFSIAAQLRKIEY
jgi:cell division transport system permease protein